MPAKNTRLGVASKRRRISWIKISTCKDFLEEEEEDDDDDDDDCGDDDSEKDDLITSRTVINRLTITINGSIAFKLILRWFSELESAICFGSKS